MTTDSLSKWELAWTEFRAGIELPVDGMYNLDNRKSLFDAGFTPPTGHWRPRAKMSPGGLANSRKKALARYYAKRVISPGLTTLGKPRRRGPYLSLRGMTDVAKREYKLQQKRDWYARRRGVV